MGKMRNIKRIREERGQKELETEQMRQKRKEREIRNL